MTEERANAAGLHRVHRLQFSTHQRRVAAAFLLAASMVLVVKMLMAFLLQTRTYLV